MNVYNPWVLVSFGMGIHSSRRSFPSRSAGGIQSDDSTFPKVCGVDSSRHGGTGMTRSRKCHVALMNFGKSFCIEHTNPLKFLRSFANLKLALDLREC